MVILVYEQETELSNYHRKNFLKKNVGLKTHGPSALR